MDSRLRWIGVLAILSLFVAGIHLICRVGERRRSLRHLEEIADQLGAIILSARIRTTGTVSDAQRREALVAIERTAHEAVVAIRAAVSEDGTYKPPTGLVDSGELGAIASKADPGV